MHAVVAKVCCYSVVEYVYYISPYNAKVKEKCHKKKRHHDTGKETVPASHGFDLGYSYQTAGQGSGGGAAVEDKVSVLCYFICCAAHCWIILLLNFYSYVKIEKTWYRGKRVYEEDGHSDNDSESSDEEAAPHQVNYFMMGSHHEQEKVPAVETS